MLAGCTHSSGTAVGKSGGVFFVNWIGFLFAARSMPASPAGYHRHLQRSVMGEVIQ
jgi:hypothetical protein